MIEADLRSWSQEVLEVPNPHLSGMPACPFAKRAWKDGKVLVVEAPDILHESRKQCAAFSSSGKDLIVVASYTLPDRSALHEFALQMHQEFPALHCMEFHPDYDAGDAELDFLTDNTWASAVDEPYCMLFIQDLRTVVAASDRLAQLGYYEVYPPDEYEALVANRKRRLSNDET